MAIVEGSRIRWAFGTVPVERLNDGRPDWVATLRGGRIQYASPAKSQAEDFDGSCVRIETDTGRELICTPDQMVYAGRSLAETYMVSRPMRRSVHLSVGLMKGAKVTVKRDPMDRKWSGRAYFRRNVPTVSQAVGVAEEVLASVRRISTHDHRMVVMLMTPPCGRQPRLYATKAGHLTPGMYVMEEDLMYSRIVSVTPAPVGGMTGRVFDVALERTGNYVANGIFVGGW